MKLVIAVLLSVQLGPGLVQTRPLNSNDDHYSKNTKAMMYLMRYGYMDHLNVASTSGRSNANLLSSDTFVNSIRDFQRFAGLNETGVMDEETERMMSLPRCGVKDFVGHGSKERRKKRYALQGSRWRVKDLTYKISSYPTTKRLTRSQVDDEIATALNTWARHTDLTFTQRRSGRVHIDIRFESRDHGDGDPFDGQGGTLAHAFFPVFGGDAHFDNDEFWTSGTFTGTNLLQTAAHEFGHSLGLSHSDRSSALMAPFYRGFQTKVRLDKDDINGIQELYGEKSKKPSRPIFTNNNGNGDYDDDDEEEEEDDDDNNIDIDDEELCNDATIDAIVTVKDGTTYTFKGRHYWKLTDDSIAKGYPRLISRDWEDLPNNLDAAFTWTNGRTYFFKGSQYWRFTNQNLDDGYPKDIDRGFEGIPNNVDAAFVWSGNEKIYFFKGSKYYKFDPEKKPPVSRAYPKPVSNWEGIPNNIDDALRYSNGYTYFFKDGLYWRFDDTKFKVDSANPDFPREAGFWWFGCSSINQGKVPTTSTSTTERNGRGFGSFNPNKNGGGGGWIFNWMNDRADVPVSDHDTSFDKGDEDKSTSSTTAKPVTTTSATTRNTSTSSSSWWRRVKGVFNSLFSG